MLHALLHHLLVLRTSCTIQRAACTTQHEPYPAYMNIPITFGWPQVEAELLFREFANYPGDLVHFSYKISDTINAATDAIVAGSPKRASFAFIAVAVPPVLLVIISASSTQPLRGRDVVHTVWARA